jgi:uncharacterized membrane-anchored protein
LVGGVDRMSSRTSCERPSEIFTATSLGLGYLDSVILFGAVILIPALVWWQFGLNDIVAFWMAYVVTRPLGASFADYISKPREISGIGFGDGPTAVVFAVAVFVFVSCLTIARPDIQQPGSRPGGCWGSHQLARSSPG